MKRKDFDCVEMKRAGARRVQGLLKGMTRTEQDEYWRKLNEELVRTYGARLPSGTSSDSRAAVG